jgi:hypothetical protein
MQRLLKEEITEEFLEKLVDKSIERLLVALETIDVSLDYIAAALSDDYADAAAVSARQTGDIR